MNSITLEELLTLQEVHIFVAGDIILDEYLFGDSSRLSPEAPVPVVKERSRAKILGGSANVASNIASLGAQVTLCGRVGEDLPSNEVENLCAKWNIQFLPIKSSQVPTTIKTRIFSGKQQIVRIDHEKETPLEAEHEILALNYFNDFCSKKNNFKALVISDYAKGFLTETLTKKLIELAANNNIPVIVDPKNLDLTRYANADIIKPNLSEGRALIPHFNAISLETEIEEIFSTIFKIGNFKNIVLSLSEKGVALAKKENAQRIRLPTRALQVSDVSGAGDTMIALLAMGAARRLDSEKALFIANLASGMACEKLGTATLSFPELVEGLEKRSDPLVYSKVTDVHSIKKLCLKLKSAGKKIVFTNGCFDILHAGHTQLLQSARRLGDYLILGLNSDSSIRRLKGESRPIQNESDRCQILASLACVDAVVLFSEDTPLNLVSEILPDILVKGGDWQGRRIEEADLVTKIGGKVLFLPLLENRSTTNIIKKSQRELKT